MFKNNRFYILGLGKTLKRLVLWNQSEYMLHTKLITPEITLDVTSPDWLEGYMLHQFSELIACNISASTLITNPCYYQAQSRQPKADNSMWHVAYLGLIEIYPFQSDYVDQNSSFYSFEFSCSALVQCLYSILLLIGKAACCSHIHICSAFAQKELWRWW